MNPLKKGALVAFQAYKKRRIGKIEALGHDTILGWFSIRLDDGVIFSTSCCLVVLLGDTRPIMTDSHSQAREWF